MVARWLSFPFEQLWRLTDTVRDRAIRRLDERLDLALTAHAGRLSEQIADTAEEQQGELASGLRSVEICLDSVLRELARLQGLVDELSAVHAVRAPAGTATDEVGEVKVLPFQRREAA